VPARGRIADELGEPRRGEDVDLHSGGTGVYYATDRASGLQVSADDERSGRHARRRTLALLRHCLADPEGTGKAGMHSTYCMCGARGCPWSERNRGLPPERQRGRRDLSS